MKKLLSLAMALILTTLMLCSCGSGAAQGSTEATHFVTVELKSGGKIEMELYGGIAPKTVENFVSLARDGFYDGIIFHRVVPGFVIQAGDPDGTGFGGSGKTIVGEFSENGYNNTLAHKRGVLSMARKSSGNDTATSQFFICLDDRTASSLDGKYAAFGRVTSGMEEVDSIAAAPCDSNQKPLADIAIKTVTVRDAD